MHFYKYTGLGNDFVFLDGETALQVTNPSTLAQRICNRRFGVGADGLVLLLPSKKADIRMRIFNADGSEAEMCGNASRCVPLHLRRVGQLDKTCFILETLAGLICTEIMDETNNLVRVNMGAPRSQQTNVQIEVNGKQVTGTCVSMGNPHFVILVDDISRVDVSLLGPQVEVHPFFPHKTNVEFVQVLDKNTVRMRVWERGAGITQACGTGACATAVACALSQKTEMENLHVILDGGTLKISWPNRKEVWMTGPAQLVFTGDF